MLKPLKDPFAQSCLERLQFLGDVTGKAMFGGYGFWVDGVTFACIFQAERLYFRADAQTLPEFEAVSAEQFVYESKGKLMPMSYWAPPLSLMDRQQDFERFARLGAEAAHRHASAKPPKKKKV